MKNWIHVEQAFQNAGICYEQKDWIFLCEIESLQFYYSPQSGKWRVKRTRAWQNNLKKHWAIWRQNFGDDETAMVEGLFACESLSRNIACLISRQPDYYHYFKLDDDNDLSRLCHFNELKNL